MLVASIGLLVAFVPIATRSGSAAPPDTVVLADDAGTFTLTAPATWTEVQSDPAADEAGVLYPRLYAAPAGAMADFAAPGVILSSWPGSPAAAPDPANVGRNVPDGCTETTPVGPAALPALPNAIAGVWACGDISFTSVQGNTADGGYLVAVTLRTPASDEPLRLAVLESLTATGGTGPATLPPVETAGLAIEDPGDPARTARLRVERQVDQASTLTHDVELTMTGSASNDGLGQVLSQDRVQRVHLVGSTRTSAAERDGSYAVVLTPTEITDRTETPDGVGSDQLTALVGLPIERRFGPDGVIVGASAADEATATDDQQAMMTGLPVESISLPATPVGVGATWTAPASFTVLPVTATAPAHYRLDALDGDRFTVTVAMDVDLATVEPDAFTESNSGRFTRSMTIEGSLTNAADLTITRTDVAQLTNVERETGTVYEVEMTATASSVEVPA